MAIRMHNHHIVPRHVGGTDEGSNLILLTIPEHANAHWELFIQFNRWEDELAYLALSGQNDKTVSLAKQAAALANIGKKATAETRAKMRIAHRGRAKISESTRAKRSASLKGRYLGAKNSKYKGASIGVHKVTGEVVRLEGRKAIQAAGFRHSGVSRAISGHLPHHKGFTWTREDPKN